MKLSTHKTTLVLSIFLILVIGSTGCSEHHSSRQKPSQHGSKQGPPSKDTLFQKFDKNNDDRLSKEEFPGPDTHFTQFDANKDGYLEKDEMPEGPPPRD